MSLVGSRVNMTHACTIERTADTPPDAWGSAPAPAWSTHLADVPCRAWTSNGGEAVKEGQSIVPLLQVHVLLPLGTDVTERDRLASVTYRGALFQAGPLGIRAVITRRDHIELLLEKVG